MPTVKKFQWPTYASEAYMDAPVWAPPSLFSLPLPATHMHMDEHGHTQTAIALTCEHCEQRVIDDIVNQGEVGFVF